ncbi:S16 family serine protease [Paenibacillus harenae]|uniref:PDZ domain-containing protein n=1 Tax=Paenibacillus harenae TaxID=306543 RepID=A0ABT9U068_PAEHA|nr:S16 family serine protease [Paenibacillus harenae]MDQ0113032.1 PDZ domain-containing protein [Paenibacillus harenae]
MDRQVSDLKRIALVAVATAAAMWILLYAPTPYVVYEPGIATPVAPMVTAEQGDAEGEGTFLLTAVKLSDPNFFDVLRSAWDKDEDVMMKKDVFRGYTQQQYQDRLSVIMEGSQNNAVEAAYRYLELPFAFKVQAIVVSDISVKAEEDAGLFQAGDKLIGLAGGPRFESTADMLDKLRRVDAGSHVATIDIERDGALAQVEMDAARLGPSLTKDRLPAVFGASGLTELRSLEPGDARKRLAIKAGDIGGPSAGLVFALQSIDLLTVGDLTGGSRIAATGTITPDGKVGPIGGIKQKVVITSREGAQLFLVPEGNYKEAKAKAKQLGTAMEVVGVTNLKDALGKIKQFNASTRGVTVGNS